VQFACKKCGEQWAQELVPGEPLVECPVCGEIVARIPVPAPSGAATVAPSPARVPVAAASAPSAGIGEHTTRIVDDQPEVTAFTPVAASAPPPRTPRPASGSAPTARVSSGGLAGEMQHMLGKVIGGYRIESLLGVGGMGAVFLAHQLSLDRKVALKILPARFAQNAELLARFTREALSAAQLNHHNIVQVYDVGSEGDTHFISMEYVRGDTLAAGVKKDGRLQIDDAAGFVLQAARGLHYAHERGIIHRDIKPGNLMVNEHGIVKIADMGLAKMRGVAEKAVGTSHTPSVPATPAGHAGDELTMHDIAMGTPSYMAPEQARDASSVTAQADQYSLGCTLYYLVAGQAPYSGTTALELISKHQKEPPPPLETHVHNVPPAFATIVNRMLAKRPEDRYPSLADVVHDLEAFLGVESDKGPYTPREQHLAALDRELKNYYAAPAARTRRLAVAVFNIAIPVLLLLAIFMGQFRLAGGLIGLGALTLFSTFVVQGLRTRAYLFRRVRSVFFGMPLVGWLKFVGAVLLGLGVLYVLGWLAWWIAFVLVGVALAAAYQFLVVGKLREQRAEPVNRVQTMLRELRVRGLAEDALHDFVARFSGADWEEFFEDLFGYEAMVAARAKWATGDQPVKRRKFATWRDPLARWLDSVEDARKTAREKKQLAKVETARLKAQGVTTAEAEKQAEVEATRIIEQDVVRAFHQREKETEALKVSSRRRRNMPSFVYRCVRVVVGAFVTLVGAVALGYAPDVTGGFLRAASGWGFPGGFAALATLAAGVVLLATVLSAHVINATLIFIGTLLLACGPRLAELAAQPLAGSAITFYVALLMVLGGLVLNILAMLAGKKF
jgi:serine/threonine protein kinase